MGYSCVDCGAEIGGEGLTLRYEGWLLATVEPVTNKLNAKLCPKCAKVRMEKIKSMYKWGG